jgi:hypothetical protein
VFLSSVDGKLVGTHKNSTIIGRYLGSSSVNRYTTVYGKHTAFVDMVGDSVCLVPQLGCTP